MINYYAPIVYQVYSAPYLPFLYKCPNNDSKTERNELIPQSVPGSWRLHLSCLSGWLSHSLVEHGQVRSSSVTHVLRRWSLLLFCHDCDPSIHWL
jgi:hypothetical protein